MFFFLRDNVSPIIIYHKWRKCIIIYFLSFGCTDKCTGNGIITITYYSLIVVFAVATVFDIVHVVAGFLAEQAGSLGAGDMEALLTPGPVAGHAGPRGGLGLATLLLA